MAKTGVVKPDPPAASRMAELKKELQRLVRTIVDDDDYDADAIDQANQALLALKDLKTKKGGSRSTSMKLRGTVSCPEEFLCPVSKDVMRDPVIVATGQTYDRVSIKKWLKAGNRTCPQTQQVLSHIILTPNHLIRDMISKWCKSQGIELPNPVQYIDEDMPTNAERSKFVTLINKMSSSSMAEQKEAAKELRCLTKKMPSFRALFGESPDAIAQLLNPIPKLKSETGEIPIDLHEDVITTLLNLSIHDSNKEIVAETPNVIPLLVDGLKAGTIQIRSNAAAALFTLSAVKPNKRLIGDSGALKPLINLIEEGHPLAMNDAASAIFSLCMINENRAKAVEDGAVVVIMKKIETRSYVDELVTILAILSTHPRAIDEMAELRAVQFLLRSIRESSCSQNKENCVAILHAICSTYRNKLKEMREEEDRHQTLSELARSGTSRAKRKASGILERLHRTINLTHTA